MEIRVDDDEKSECVKANDELRNIKEAIMTILVQDSMLMKMEMKKNNDKAHDLLLRKQEEQH